MGLKTSTFRSMFTIWPLDTIIDEYHRLGVDKDFVGFCDWCIASYAIGYHKQRAGIFKDFDLASGICATTFKELLEKIVANSEDLY